MSRGSLLKVSLTASSAHHRLFAFLPPLKHPLPGDWGSMVAGLSPSGVVEHSGKADAAIQRSD